MKENNDEESVYASLWESCEVKSVDPNDMRHVSFHSCHTQSLLDQAHWLSSVFWLAHMFMLGRICYQTCQTHSYVAGMTVMEHSATYRFTSAISKQFRLAYLIRSRTVLCASTRFSFRIHGRFLENLVTST